MPSDEQATNDPMALALASALDLCCRYLDERQVPDDVADDDVRVLESVATYLLSVPEALRPRLMALVGPWLADATGLVDAEQHRTARD